MTRPLTVLSVAYPLAPVGPDAVGGAEQILSAIDRGLVAAGHRSIVVARQGSETAGELVPVPAYTGTIDEAMRRNAHAAVRRALARTMHAADVVHLHGIDFAAYLPPPGPPALVTLHLPVSWYDSLAPARPETFLHCVSASQHASCPPDTALLPPIGNGVDVATLGKVRQDRQAFALMLGRICPEKGQHLAIAAARAAGIPLIIAGEAYPYPAHRDYLDTQVRPLLDATRRWIGPVGLARKSVLLAAARCVLIPSLAPETSSLVAIEALACGTPVIAFRSGALPEIVSDGITGFLVADAREMARAIDRTGDIDPEACRAAARERFSQERMIADYIARYRTLLSARAMAAD